MAWLRLVHLCVLSCVCQTVLTQAEDESYDVSMWQRAPDYRGLTLPGGLVVPGGIFDVPENLTDCVCVHYYQCTADNWLNSEGAGVLDRRFGDRPGEWNVERCPDEAMRCCNVPTQAPIEPPGPAAAPTCGLQKDSVIDKIILRIKDGDEAEFAEFPWMLALMNVVTIPEGDHINIFACGASLIHPQVAMTAAHCITSTRKKYSNVRFKVRAGEWDTNTTEELFPHQDQEVERVILREGFNKASLVNDIALLILSQPLELADNVGTVCLPEPGDQFPGVNCVATGWGREAFDVNHPYETIMHKVELHITPALECQEGLQKTRLGPNYRLNPSFVCAMGKEGSDTCKGDGGGPLVCHSPHNPDHYVQVGIVSWGVGCGNGTPSVYTDVSRQRAWINEILAKEGMHVESGPNPPNI